MDADRCVLQALSAIGISALAPPATAPAPASATTATTAIAAAASVTVSATATATATPAPICCRDGDMLRALLGMLPDRYITEPRFQLQFLPTALTLLACVQAQAQSLPQSPSQSQSQSQTQQQPQSQSQYSLSDCGLSARCSQRLQDFVAHLEAHATEISDCGSGSGSGSGSVEGGVVLGVSERQKLCLLSHRLPLELWRQDLVTAIITGT
jgi:hypothetical protein